MKKHLRAAWAQFVSDVMWRLHQKGLVSKDTAEWHYGIYVIRKVEAAKGLDINWQETTSANGWQCEHMSISGNLSDKPKAYCGCDLKPYR